jgi:hypothetical protein
VVTAVAQVSSRKAVEGKASSWYCVDDDDDDDDDDGGGGGGGVGVCGGGGGGGGGGNCNDHDIFNTLFRTVHSGCKKSQWTMKKARDTSGSVGV